ncbi:hypothetical protein LTR17_003979 [Elasticomyces elasticus]|nr:hypothetical protein LTR17_003979 [Elasticomyces elasticus]
MPFRQVMFTAMEDKAVDLYNKVKMEPKDVGIILELHPDYATSSMKMANVRMDDGTEGWITLDDVAVGTGWPYVAVKSWDPEKEAEKHLNPAGYRLGMGKGVVRLRADDEGKILRYRRDLNWVEITIPRRGLQGWVPANAIEPGTGRVYGDIRVVNVSPAEGLSTDDVEPDTQPSLTGSTLLALFTAIAENHAKVPHMEEWAREAIEDEAGRQQLTDTIVAGYEYSGQLDVFNNPDSTWEQVIDASCPPESTEAGLYGWTYPKLTKGPFNTRVYVGSTGDTSQRMSTYDKPPGQDSRNGMHAAALADSEDAESILICALPRPDANRALLYWAEEATFLLTGSYIDTFLTSAGVTIKASRPDTVDVAVETIATKVADRASFAYDDDEKEYLDDVPLAPKDEDPASAEDQDSAAALRRRKGAKFSVMKATAVALISIADEVFEKVGWTPILERSGGRFGDIGGLNIQSPVAAPYAKPVFSRIRLPSENLTIYRRIAILRAGETDADANCRFHVSYEGGGGFYFSMKWEAFGDKAHRPSYGDKVYVIWEVTDGERHPRTFAGLPTVNLYDDDIRAGTLALRIEWFKDGQWWATYIPDYHNPFRIMADVPGSILALAKSIGILNMLERCSMKEGEARPFDRIFAVPRIIDVSFDNLTQEVRLVEVTGPLTMVKAGEERDEQEMIDDLEQAGASNINTHGQVELPGPTSKRRTCDRCYFANLTASQTAKFPSPLPFRVEQKQRETSGCHKGKDDEKCSFCKLFGPPCTATDSSECQKNEALQLALWASKISGPEYKAFKIGDPGVENSLRTIGGHGEEMTAATTDLPKPKPKTTLADLAVFEQKANDMYQVQTLAGRRALAKLFISTALVHTDLGNPYAVSVWHGLRKFLLQLVKMVEDTKKESKRAGLPFREEGAYDKLIQSLRKTYGQLPLDYTSFIRSADGGFVENRVPSIGEVKALRKVLFEKQKPDKAEQIAKATDSYLYKLATLFSIEEAEAKALGKVMLED